MIDREVKHFIDDAYSKAMTILRNNRDKLNALADALLVREVLDAEEINIIVAGEKLPVEKKKALPLKAAGTRVKARKSFRVRAKSGVGQTESSVGEGTKSLLESSASSKSSEKAAREKKAASSGSRKEEDSQEKPR